MTATHNTLVVLCSSDSCVIGGVLLSIFVYPTFIVYTGLSSLLVNIHVVTSCRRKVFNICTTSKVRSGIDFVSAYWHTITVNPLVHWG